MTTLPMPSKRDLMLPVLRAVRQLGGSASRRQIIDLVIETVDPSGSFPVGRMPPGVATLDNRIGWAISCCKWDVGLLEHPRRAFYVLNAEGNRVAGLTDSQAKDQLDKRWKETHAAWKEERAATEHALEEATPPAEDVWRSSLLTHI